MGRYGRLLLLLGALAAPSRVFGAAPIGEDQFELRNLGQCGLVTRYASSQVADQCLQTAINVYLDEDNGITRRRGFSKYNTTAITGTRSVRGVWPFRATDGTEYIVVLSSETMFQSDGDGAFTAITGLNDMSSTQDMDCSQCLGRLWCVNGSDTMFSWDGTSTDTVSTAPTCSQVECFRNRVALTNCSTSLSQLRLSGELDGEDYTIPTAPVSTSPAAISIGGANDGNNLLGFMGVYQDVLVMGKRDSTWGLYGFDRRDFAVREISREVGLVDARSSREKQGSLYWLSKRGLEKMTGPSITRVSDPVRDLIDTIIVAGGNTRSATDTSQTDFEAGNLTASGAGAPLSASLSPGNVVATSATRTDDSDADWDRGTHNGTSTSAVAGFLVMASSNVSRLLDNFSDNQLTSNPAWTEDDPDNNTGVLGNYADIGTAMFCRTTTSSDYGEPTYFRGIRTRGGISYGTWKINVFNGTTSGNSASNLFIYQFIRDPSTNAGYSLKGARTSDFNTQNMVLTRYDGTSDTVLASGQVTLNSLEMGEFSVTRSTHGLFTLSYEGVFSSSATDRTYSPSEPDAMVSVGGINQGCSDPIVGVATVSVAVYRSTGHYRGAFFDTNLSTPTGGVFSVSSTTPTGTTLAFNIRSGASETGPFSNWSAITNGSNITEVNRYYQYVASFTTTVDTASAAIDYITLDAATTGYFISQCRNPGTSITSWGLFQCNNTSPVGSVTFWVSTGPACHGVTRTTATWTAQTNNTVITVATAAYVAYRALVNFPVFYSSATPRLNDCTINWNEGASRPSVSAEVYKDRYYLAYTSGTSGTVANDHLLVLDSRDQWVLHDAPNCAALGLYQRSLYCGDSANTGYLYKMDVGQDDDGASFMSRVRTKDFNFGQTWQKKTLNRLYYDLAGLPDPGYAISLTPAYTLEASTDTFTLDAINLAEDYSRYLAPKVPVPVGNNATARWFSFDLEHSGTQGPWKLFGLKVVFTRLAED